MRLIKILDINFIDGSYMEIKKKLDKGGLMVVPSGPGLSSIESDQDYYESLKNADFAIFDSAYFCFLLLLLKGKKVKKYSGLKFLRDFLNDYKTENSEKKIFLVNPSIEEQKLNIDYLKKKNIVVNQDYNHVAPDYSKKGFNDKMLFEKLNRVKPKYIILNIGGGIQEVLGYELKKKLSYTGFSIICTGAAMAFLTGKQAQIPSLIDSLGLGWLARIISRPKMYSKRYYSAIKLYGIVNKTKI